MSDTVLAIIELDNFPKTVANRAAWIASLYGLELHLMLSDPSLRLFRDELIISNAAREIREQIEAAQEQLLADLGDVAAAAHGLSVTSSVIHDRPAQAAIIERATDMQPRFVVKGTQYQSQADRATITFTDWQLIRKLDSPLWLVKPSEMKEESLIVAAVDPTHKHDEAGVLDQAIVDAGKSVAAKSGGELILLHTCQSLADIGHHAMFEFKPVKLPVEEIDSEVSARHRQKLEALASANDIDAEAVHQLPGRTSDILPTFARTRDAGLVVMGAVARAGLMQRALGSTAERVLDHLHCDVLIARAESA